MISSEQKFKDRLEKINQKIKLIKFSESTKTANDAAERLNVKIEQIGKSIVFKTQNGRFVLVITSGINRVNEKLLEKRLSDSLVKIDADEIKEYVGYPIGGIPPFGHDNKVIIFIDEDLLKFEKIFCAGGTPNTIFEINPHELLKITSAEVIKVK